MRRLLRSFGYAFRGLGRTFAGQPNFRIHIVAAALVVLAGLVAGLSLTEWSIITLVIALVIALELVNTAIETLTDMVSPEYNEKAGRLKDAAAAAVLVAAIAAVIIGAMIFLPKIF